MKRTVLLILVLLLMVDLTEDGCLGQARFYLPHSSARTSVSSPHSHSGPGQANLRQDPAPPASPEGPRDRETRPATLAVLPTLQMMRCCHASGAGGIPL
jgi:hypothetical protein